jgi:hypothetical protein
MLYAISVQAVVAVLSSVLAASPMEPASAPQEASTSAVKKCDWASDSWIPPTAEELLEAKLDCDADYSEPLVTQAVAEGQQSGGLLALGDHFYETIQYPCWAELDPCTGAYRIADGHPAAHKFTGGGSGVYCESWHGQYSGLCDYQGDMGTVNDAYDLVLYTFSPSVADATTTEAACFLVEYTATEYASDDCTGTRTRGPLTDDVYFVSSSSGTETSYAFCDDKADCDGSWGDSCDSDWHLPDVLFSSATNPSSGTYSYYTRARIRMCDSDCSSNCTVWVGGYGCFTLTWQ